MQVVVIGLGNMGICVLAAAAKRTHGRNVYGIDLDPTAAFKRARHEPDVLESYQTFVDAADVPAADGRVFILCVPTPVSDEGVIDYRIAESVCDKLSPLLNKQDVVICHGTLYVGGASHLADQLGGKAEFVYMPVFLRAGRGVHDYLNPARLIIGSTRPLGKTIEGYLDLMWPKPSGFAMQYERLKPIPRFSVGFGEAEALKLWHNGFMTVKVAFANELGEFCKRLRLNSQEVFDALWSDEKALLSRSHLSPGGPYCGPCLSKDDISLVRAAGGSYYCELVAAARRSNDKHRGRLIDEAVRLGTGKTICVKNLTFKSGYDDPRRSAGIYAIWVLSCFGFLKVFGWDPILSAMSPEEYRLACRGDNLALAMESKILGTDPNDADVILDMHAGAVLVLPKMPTSIK